MDINKTEMKKPHSDLKEKIIATELAILNVSKLRNDLDDNSVMVKSEVQKSISVHLDQLRQREMQLLRQVDALISHQSDMLQLQLSKLYQVLGRFKAASQWGTEDELALKTFNSSDEDISSISTRHIHYLPNYEANLASAISAFGRFEAIGAPTNVLLLPEEEEYGDGDHHVLHKTLQVGNNEKIKVCFPKFSTDSMTFLDKELLTDCMFDASKIISTDMCSEKTPDNLTYKEYMFSMCEKAHYEEDVNHTDPTNKIKVIFPKLSTEPEDWILSQPVVSEVSSTKLSSADIFRLRKQAEMTDMCQTNSTQNMLLNTTSKSKLCSPKVTTKSEERIPNQPDSIVVRFPKLSTEPNDWLLNQQTTESTFDMCEIGSNKSGSIELLSYPDLDDNHIWLHPTNKSSCSCQDMGEIEIENLDSLTCVPAKPTDLIISIPSIESVCKSNSTKKCSSFENCVCEESCLVTSLKGQLKKQNLGADFQQDCINTAIKESSKQSDQKLWLIKNEFRNNCDKWLASCKPQVFNDSKMLSIEDDRKWLMTDSNKSMKKFTFSSGKLQENSSIWLLNEANNDNCINEQEKDTTQKCRMEDADLWLFAAKKNTFSRNVMRRQAFDLYFQPADTKIWLGSKINPEKAKEWLVKS